LFHGFHDPINNRIRTISGIPCPAEIGGLQKNRIYARAGVLEYWIVNLVERQIEVYSDPTGPVSEPVYRIRKDYLPGSAVPLVLEGKPIGTIAVDAVLP